MQGTIAFVLLQVSSGMQLLPTACLNTVIHGFFLCGVDYKFMFTLVLNMIKHFPGLFFSVYIHVFMRSGAI